MSANTNGFDKAPFWEKRVFRGSIIDVGVSVYSRQLSVIRTREQLWRLAVDGTIELSET